ncbi:hypothetical protein [Demequina aurantiaca]|uniref:hypothetical protein n=1 Tax=Demequina aurantiaca TaxID=676200 RepID=UPI0007846BFA|nr:hypothetical protein [Demequina aurantiaca]
MDGLRNPIGEEPPEVYWKRRLIVGIGIVVLIALVWFIVAKATDGSNDPAATPSDAATTSPAPTSGATTSPDPSASANAAAASRACGPEDLTITTTANPADVAAGSPVTFDVDLAQDGSSPCLLDTTADGTELLITSGSDRIYSSTDCPADEAVAATQLVLEPGTEDTVAVTWNGKRSAPDCEEVSASPRAGTYNAALTVQGIESDSAVFRLQ